MLPAPGTAPAADLPPPRPVTADLERLVAQRTAELAEANEAAQNRRAEFVANMSHELRTPLNGIIGLANLLLEMSLGPTQREYVDTIRSSADELLHLINDVLDYSKIEARELQPEVAPVDVVGLVDDVVTSLRAPARAKWLLLEGHVAPDARRLVLADRTRVRQVLVNLVGNAVKFTDTGSVTVVVTRRSLPDGRACLRFDVMDTGIGIDPGDADRLFEPFVQGDASTTRRFGGTGLGLTISRELVRVLDGRIGADGAPGRGSTFWFEIPFGEIGPDTPVPGLLPAPDRTREAAPVASAPAVRPPALPPGAVHVLVVEDNRVNQLVVSRMLEQIGAHVTVAADGREACDLVLIHRFDLICMDCQMPGMDGYAATQAIRNGAPTQVTRPGVPIIALTANTTDEDRARCLEAGMDDFLPKPLRRDALEAAVLHWLVDRPHRPAHR